ASEQTFQILARRRRHRLFGGSELGVKRTQIGQGVLDRVAHGLLGRQLWHLWQVTDPTGRPHPDLTGVWSIDAGDQPEQGRLAGTVLADDADPLAERHRLAYAVQHDMPTRLVGDVVEDESKRRADAGVE